MRLKNSLSQDGQENVHRVWIGVGRVSAGFGTRGEIEVSRTDTETNVLIPWRIAIRASLALNVCTVFALAIIIILWSLIHWQSLWDHVTSKWVRIWLLPFPAAWIVVFLMLVRFDQISRLKNANWPPPWAQMQPLESGFVTRRNMDDRMYEDRDEPPPIPWVMEAYYKAGSKTLWHERFETEYAWEWHRYAKALTNPTKWLRPSFSYRAARKTFKIPETEFKEKRLLFLAHGQAKSKQTPNGNAKTWLTRKGEVLFEMMARTPPPQG